MSYLLKLKFRKKSSHLVKVLRLFRQFSGMPEYLLDIGLQANLSNPRRRILRVTSFLRGFDRKAQYLAVATAARIDGSQVTEIPEPRHYVRAMLQYGQHEIGFFLGIRPRVNEAVPVCIQ